MATLNIALLAFQEYSSAIGGFIGLMAGITLIFSAIQYVKNNPNYIVSTSGCTYRRGCLLYSL